MARYTGPKSKIAMNFCNPKKQFPAEEMKACAESIATNM